MYGLDIQRSIQGCSKGRITMSTGTLYSMLKRLRDDGYITSVSEKAPSGGANREYYSLTNRGREIVDFINSLICELQGK